MTTITTQEQAALTSAEQQLFEQHESTIEKGLQTFYAVGYALADIRNHRLYRAEYGTFEEYCQQRWNMNRRYANRLVQAAEIADNLGPIGPRPENEAQTRPLAKLPPDEQGEAWEEAVKRSGGKPTAKVVEQVVKERIQPPMPPEPEPEPEIPAEAIAWAEEVLGVNQQPVEPPELPPGWYFQDSSNPDDIIAINRNNHEQTSGFCETHEQAAARAWGIHQSSQQPEPEPELPARIIDMSEERREAMMAELEALGYDVKYHKGCVSNKRKGAPGHMNENIYYVEEFERRLQIARQNFERDQEQQADRERMRTEIARQREEYQSWPEQSPVCTQTIKQCMVDAYKLIKAGDTRGAKLQAQRFRAHPDVAGIISHAIWGMQCAMEEDSGNDNA